MSGKRIQAILLLSLQSVAVLAFVPSLPRSNTHSLSPSLTINGYIDYTPHNKKWVTGLHTSSGNNAAPDQNSEDEDASPVFAESVVRVDDGGSDLTDRFKYKVNALMGTYNPTAGTPDDENQSGNILNAMLNFPARYSFTVVGRTGDNDDDVTQYVNDVKNAVTQGSGDDDGMECLVKPRGTKFTRVTVEVKVENAAIVNSIYETLEKIDSTVMRF